MSLLALDARRGTSFSGCFLPRQDKATGARAGVEIGFEGMTGMSVVLGNHRWPHSTYIQVAGEGQRITSVELRKAMASSESLRGLLLKYVQVFMVQYGSYCDCKCSRQD